MKLIKIKITNCQFVAMILFFTAISLIACASNKGKVKISHLTCDYLENPILVSSQTPCFGWQLISGKNDVQQSAYAIEVYVDSNGEKKKIWNSGKVQSFQNQRVKYKGKTKLETGKKYNWKVQIWDHEDIASEWSETATFFLSPLDIESKAQWIGAIKKEDSHIPEGRNYHALAITSEAAKKWQQTHPLSKRSIYLRKPFETRGKVKSAIIYICGLGHYELSLNGEKVGDNQFAPLWSDYDKTVYYNAYDVTENIETKNTVGILLGNGFYNEQGGRYVKMQVSFGPPTLFFKMQLTYEDGSREEIVSDESWKYSLSPIVFNDMYGGEDYDAQLEQKGWNTYDFDDSKWQQVVAQEPPKGKLTPQTAPPVKIMETYPIKEIKKGENFYTLDMGQNLTGFPLIKVSGKKGDKIRLIVGENLNEDGSVNQSQSGAPYYYEYTLQGGEEEIWHPRFSYYGYRYIQIEGGKMKNSKDDRDLPVINDVKSCFVYNSAPQTGHFYCSNTIFNDAHRIIVNAMKSNFHAVFTDCPHREKLGWLEQVHLNGPGLFYNFNLTTFAPKIMRDIRDAQLPNGLVPDIAPEYVVFEGGFRDSPEWGSTAVILPFMYYQYYGDNSLIIEYYDVIKKYVDYLSTTAKNHIVSHGLGDWYDYNEEFPAGPSRNTPIALSATTHYYMDIDYLTKAASMLGKTDDVAYYTDLKEKVKEAFNKEFFDPKTAQYGTGSQASYAMPLYAGLVDPQYKQAVLANLVKDIEKHDYKLTTGDVGNRYLFQVLAENGLNEMMYKMHNHKEVPGYGFQVQFGATTLTEQWDPRKGNSWNHFMMGQIEEWFYKSLAGITVEKDDYSGFQNIIIAPQVVGDLNFVEASYTTLHGTIEVNWKIENNIFTVNVAIPTNCSAKVYLPKEQTCKKVGSGKYSFRKTL